jgi:Nucleotidyl transferase
MRSSTPILSKRFPASAVVLVRTAGGDRGGALWGKERAVRPTSAAILAGGLGMRLRPSTTVLPKPLLPVVDQPIVEHIICRLAAHGVRRIDLCLGHLGGLIQAYFSRAITLPEDVELIYQRHVVGADGQGVPGGPAARHGEDA